MNRLILLGNGFDLAHKMKTGYYDFVFSYLKESFLTARNTKEYKDALISITWDFTYDLVDPIENIHDIEGFLYFATTETHTYKPITFGNSGVSRTLTEEVKKRYKLDILSSFFQHLLKHCCDYNWVDIENEYYQKLKEILQSRNNPKNELANLNNSLGWIIQKLENYLVSQKPAALNNAYGRIFTEKIKKDEVVTIKLGEDISPENILILNFNYTDTARNYILRSDNIKINNIHGKLNDQDNPLIFGFGDELDESYATIESDKRKGFLKYIKSFGYFKTPNYHHLIRFIESKDFQVYILGHSCGLSDRTMLNMIFEHSNCKSLKIFFHKVSNEDNYTELTEEISRHFRNKSEMRKKIVSRKQSEEMPQV